MMVPRSFQFSAASPPKAALDEKSAMRRNIASRKEDGRRRSEAAAKPAEPVSPAPPTTQPVRVPTPPIPVRTPERTHSAPSKTMLKATHNAPHGRRRKSPAHDPNALPPAVAALLAVTQIPRPKPGQFRSQRSKSNRRISIDELVNEWKNDDSLIPSLSSSSPALGILLEDTDAADESYFPAGESVAAEAEEDEFSYKRSTSLESVPSLDADDRSVLSNSSLSTPESLRSKKSISNLRKASPRSIPTTEVCDYDHPLNTSLSPDEAPDEEFLLSPSATIKTAPAAHKPKSSSFTSNLTTSLQALKAKALNSFSSLSFSNTIDANPQHQQQQQQQRSASPFSDDVLWSHPFLFPRFSPEIRPATTSTSTARGKAQGNNAKAPPPAPTPLTFEEQEAPYQLALHAPYLAEQRVDCAAAPTIQMQTYGSRGNGRKGGRVGGGGRRAGGPDPSSEAGRALLGEVHTREVRENGDFLRVVVLEMEMKRKGKLEVGKARIWLPPRQVGPSAGGKEMGGKGKGGVPRRWVGETISY